MALFDGEIMYVCRFGVCDERQLLFMRVLSHVGSVGSLTYFDILLGQHQ